MAKSSPIRSLNPKLVDGLVVVGGRVSRLTSPVILHHDHILSQRVILEWHNIVHLGTEWLLSLIREKFWITRARHLIQKLKRNCVKCQRLYGQPMLQMMFNLPPERCTPHEPPFTYTGLDLFGPFNIKVGLSEVKRYGRIFTCFGTRAVHIEVLSSPESDTFINGFFRFIARRGSNLVGPNQSCPKVCISWTVPKSFLLHVREWLNGFFTRHCLFTKVESGKGRYERFRRFWLPS